MRMGAADGSGDSAAEALAGPVCGETLGGATRQPETPKATTAVESEMKVFIVVEIHHPFSGSGYSV